MSPRNSLNFQIHVSYYSVQFECIRYHILTVCTSLRITYTPNYPNEIPEFELVDNSESMTFDYLSSLKSQLTDLVCCISFDLTSILLPIQAQESLGMPMVFTLASHVKECLDGWATIEADKVRFEETERKRKEEEEEMQKFRGTPVTKESFAAWKRRFDAEMHAAKGAMNAKATDKNKKLTGRQLFESDKNMIMSDAKYADEGDVAVDMSLFEQEMENMDLPSDEDDEDEDEDNHVIEHLINSGGD